MSTTSMPSRAVVAVVTGVATAAYYSSPDYISSRTARGWVKAGLGAVTLAAAVPEFRAIRAVARERDQHTASGSTESVGALSTRGKAAVYGAGMAVVGGAVGVGVAIERWIFRHGQARSKAGVRLPHTRAALLQGALAAGLCLIPPPPAPSDNEGCDRAQPRH